MEDGQTGSRGDRIQDQATIMDHNTKSGDGTKDWVDQQARKGKGVSYSAPPKSGAPKTSSGSKFMADAQKAYRKDTTDDDRNDRVLIPDSFEYSNTESES